MGKYRVSRDIEASLVDFLKPLFLADWGIDRIEKTFKNVKGINLPMLVLRAGETDHTKAEVGDTATIRTTQVLIDIFANSDGQKLDIKDWLINNIKDGCPFLEHTVVDGEVDSTVLFGRIRVLTIEDTPVDFGIQKDDLEIPDRFHNLVTLGISIGRIET